MNLSRRRVRIKTTNSVQLSSIHQKKMISYISSLLASQSLKWKKIIRRLKLPKLRSDYVIITQPVTHRIIDYKTVAVLKVVTQPRSK